MRANSLRRTLLLPALALALGTVACNRDGASRSGEEQIGRILSVSGNVELVSGGSTLAAAEGADLRAGDDLAVEDGGTVDFELGGNAGYRLVRGLAELEGVSSLALRDATLVVTGESPVQVDLGAVELAFSEGTVRTETGPAGRVAAYRVEGLELIAGEQRVPLPALWQVSITPEGGLDQARPLQFSRDDPIDAANLQHALEADGKLGNLLRGLEPQLAAAPASAVPGRLASAGITSQTVDALGQLPRSDLLMGLAFAREWNEAELVRSFEKAMALRVLGATWGLVAQNFDVPADALVAALQSEIDAVLFPPGAAEPGQLVPSPRPAAPRPGGTARPQPPAPAPAPAPPPAGPAPAPGPSPTGSPGLIGPVVDPLRPLLPDELERIIDDLLGVVDGILPIV